MWKKVIWVDKSKLASDILKKVESREASLDKIRGCMIGGAVGDALGYPVEFMSYESILGNFGPSGITEYKIDPEYGKARISDDTQMSLFTANGLLVGQTRSALRNFTGTPSSYVYLAYLDWLKTQRSSFANAQNLCWITSYKELWDCRAPGATCLDALSSGEQGSTSRRINHSKGCGGVMRVAPIALLYHDLEDDYVDMQGAEIAALTHSHSLGFMPAAFLTHVLKHIVDPSNTMSLRDIFLDAKEAVSRLFPERKHLGVFMDLVDRAISLALDSSEPDEENISYIGDGWCGDEALCIALYCSLRYQKDFSKAMISSVNHGGDSDSTGALTGNILGAWIGYSAIPDIWKKDLELSDVILEMADDLCYGCLMSQENTYEDPDWVRKYVNVG